MVGKMKELRERLVDLFKGQDPETVFVVTYKTEKSRRTVTGKYTGPSEDLTEVVFLNEKGRFQKVPTDRIERINYYFQEHTPF